MADPGNAGEDPMTLTIDPCLGIAANMEMNGVDVMKATKQFSELIARVMANELRRMRAIESLKSEYQTGGNGEGEASASAAPGAPEAAAAAGPAAIPAKLPEGFAEADREKYEKIAKTRKMLDDEFGKPSPDTVELKSLSGALERQISMLSPGSKKFKEMVEKEIETVNDYLEPLEEARKEMEEGKTLKKDINFAKFLNLLVLAAGVGTIYFAPQIIEGIQRSYDAVSYNQLLSDQARECKLVPQHEQYPATANDYSSSSKEAECRRAIALVVQFFASSILTLQSTAAVFSVEAFRVQVAFQGVKTREELVEVKTQYKKDAARLLWAIVSGVGAMIVKNADKAREIGFNNMVAARQEKAENASWLLNTAASVIQAGAAAAAAGPAAAALAAGGAGIRGFVGHAGKLDAIQKDLQAKNLAAMVGKPVAPLPSNEATLTSLVDAGAAAVEAVQTNVLDKRSAEALKPELEKVQAAQARTKIILDKLLEGREALVVEFSKINKSIETLIKDFKAPSSPDKVTKLQESLKQLVSATESLEKQVTDAYTSDANTDKRKTAIRSAFSAIKSNVDSLPELLTKIKIKETLDQFTPTEQSIKKEYSELNTMINIINADTIDIIETNTAKLAAKVKGFKESVVYAIDLQPKSGEGEQAQQGGAMVDESSKQTINLMVIQGLDPVIAGLIEQYLESGNPTSPETEAAPATAMGGRTYRRRKGKSRRQRGTYRRKYLAAPIFSRKQLV